MQKPTPTQQRILNAMLSGHTLVYDKYLAQLLLITPSNYPKRIRADQAFHMQRKGLIEPVMTSLHAIEYATTDSYRESIK